MGFAAAMALACVIDIAVGWPNKLYRRIGHPVSWMGALINALESRWNKGARRRRLMLGMVAVLIVVVAVICAAALLQMLFPSVILVAVLAWPFVALRSMHAHVRAVAGPLILGDLEGARQAVSMIVGRDPLQLNEAGVARAALESLAENTSDGIVAPLFWGVLAGLPGIAAYKAINTMDSMIGHRTDQYEAFGKAAARLDDLVNLIPARSTCLLFALASGRPFSALEVARRDAPQHRSPNAGWPESAMAASLSVRLSGPRIYGDRVADEPWLNGSDPDPDGFSVRSGLALYRRAMFLMLCGLAVLAVL